MKLRNNYYLLFLLLFIIMSSGCTRAWNDIYQTDTDHRVTSSLVDYLFPKGLANQAPGQGLSSSKSNIASQPLKPAPTFWVANAANTSYESHNQRLTNPSNRQSHKYFSNHSSPIKVGLAFVPTRDNLPGLSQARKVSLLRQVQSQLLQYDFIQHVDIIPQIHFRGGNGFQQLEKVGDMFQLDAMALVSYDQVIHTDDNHLSVLYLTVIGAFIAPGSQYDSQTFVDTTLVDIKTKKFLLRASGIDSSKTATTLIGSTQEKRDSRYDSFEKAFNDMLLTLHNRNQPNTSSPASRQRQHTIQLHDNTQERF